MGTHAATGTKGLVTGIRTLSKERCEEAFFSAVPKLLLLFRETCLLEAGDLCLFEGVYSTFSHSSTASLSILS